jgi:predicted ATPase
LDQFQRTVPYAAFTQAFKSLIQQLLTLSTQELRVWKDKLLVALGANGQVIIDIIPELELIIGEQEAPVAPSNYTEAQNRFNQVFSALFFTLKPVGQGTGLRLSINHQMIMQHSRQLFFTSLLRLGTEFSILLPYSGEVAGS